MSTQHAVAALIHDQFGKTLKEFFGQGTSGDPLQLVGVHSAAHTLLAQLEEVDKPEDETSPPKITLFVINDIVGTSLISPLLQSFSANHLPFPLPLFLPNDLVVRLQNVLTQQLTFFRSRIDAVKDLITARDPAAVQVAGRALFSFPPFWDTLEPYIGRDVGAIFSLATLGNALTPSQQPGSVVAIEQALLSYFFKKDGYRTVDGANIVAPIHLADIGGSISNASAGSTPLAGFDHVKNLLSKATAELYLRDTVRVTVEATYDTVRNLTGKYDSTKAAVKDRKDTDSKKKAIEQKFVNWFRGFSSVAESGSMRAVEIATQGVSEFQTNPLIAAAAGSFAGTVARKIAQDSFLSVLRSDLGLRPA